ncbi:transcription termination/antitermination NusG family protein [Pseudomonas savastanoi pv. phaseolicola]|uniref:transcription termination/antitermination NusG family protein n=1 Tax=Pseudomonas syringae group genomosp. 2 TaxID=251698 RepID=UPI000E314B73|nr:MULTISPECIES: transcription termination/antitermination NusG family protein [Pseudomonas syringae group genomosp. 2]MDG6381290.1 transcription termination/antitermination NusG family protein [Pseudomonas savastanoi pv. phaseolicola]
MKNWRVLMHNSSVYQSLITSIERLDVEVYSPTRKTSRKRTDRPSSIEKEVRLFPGYLLLRFDPQVTHTTTITALNGAHGFVQFGGQTCEFGGQACVMQDSTVEGLKAASMVRANRWLDCIEFRNVPTELEKTLRLIIDMKSEAARRAAFFALLAKDAALERLVRRSGTLCYSTVNAA